MIQSLVLLAIILILPGFAIWTAGARDLRHRVSTVEAFFLVIVTSVVAVSFPAFILAEVGRFSLASLLLVVVGGSLVIGGWSIWRQGFANPFRCSSPHLRDALALILLGASFLLTARPSEYIVGGRDHGIYVNTGIYIARKGSILLRDAELAAVPAESRRALVSPEVTTAHALLPGPWSQGRHVPGTTIRELETGILAPHAYHLYPVWIAIQYALGGLPFALATTTLFSFLGALAIYLSGARLLGRPVALLALLLLILNVTQNWFSRYPSAEIVVRLLFWGGILGVILMFAARSRYAAVLAGASFGLTHLAKLDTVFVPIFLLAYFLFRWFTGRNRPFEGYLIVPYLIVLAYATLHAVFVATVYTLDQATRVLLPRFLADRVIRAAEGFTDPLEILGRLLVQNLAPILATLGVSALLLVAAVRFRQPASRALHRFGRRGVWIRGLLTASLALAMVTAYVGQSWPNVPQLEDTAESLGLTLLYLTPLGLLLGLVGLLQLIARNPAETRTEGSPLAWLLVIGNMLPLFIWGTGAYPDHFWVIRRFITVVFPALLLLAGYVLWQLTPTRLKDWPRGLLPLALTLMLAFSFWKVSRPLSSVVEYEGLAEAIAGFDRRLPEDAVLLVEKSDPAGRVSAPLWYIYDRTIFYLDGNALDVPAIESAIEAWRANGRDILWITNDEEPPVLDNYRASYGRTEEISVPLVETPIGRMPEHVGRYRMTLDVYQIVAPSQLSQWQEAVTVDIANIKEDDRVRKGVYEVERWPGLSPWRWTSDRVIIELPATGRPQELLLSMANGRPVDVVVPQVTILLDDHLLGTVTVQGETAEYALPIPEDALDGDNTLRLSLEIDPWLPAETGHSSDKRRLGVQLNWVKLVVSRPT